jgi:hypothetical protein
MRHASFQKPNSIAPVFPIVDFSFDFNYNTTYEEQKDLETGFCYLEKKRMHFFEIREGV